MKIEEATRENGALLRLSPAECLMLADVCTRQQDQVSRAARACVMAMATMFVAAEAECTPYQEHLYTLQEMIAICKEVSEKMYLR